jgi:hypothetical protein
VPTTPKSTGAEPVKVDIGGIPVTKDEIHHAISVLNSKQSTNVKGPLKVAGNPLWQMDYDKVSKEELAKYPELQVPTGTKAKHVGKVKGAILHHLAGKLAEMSSTEAEQAIIEETQDKAKAAAEHAQDLTPHTYSWGGKTATKEQLTEAAGWLEETMGGKQSFSQAMKKAGNPLATADYMGEAKKYKTAHPNTAKAWSTKKLMLESLKEHAGELAKADQETGHDAASELHLYASQKTSALKKGWAQTSSGAIAAAILYAYHNKTDIYAFLDQGSAGGWDIGFTHPPGSIYFTATPEHTLTLNWPNGETKDKGAGIVLEALKTNVNLPQQEEVKPPPGPNPPAIPPKPPEPEPPKPAPLPEAVHEPPPGPPEPAQLPTAEWKFKAASEWTDIHSLVMLAKTTDVPGVKDNVDDALATGLWGAAKLGATRYIRAKETGGWTFSKEPGHTGSFSAPGEMYYRITPDHQIIFVSKGGGETAFEPGMVLKIAQRLAKKEEAKPEPPPEPPKPAEPEAKAPEQPPVVEATQEVKVKGKLVAMVPADAVIYVGQGADAETASQKYVKFADGKWVRYGTSGTPYEEPVQGKYQAWLDKGILIKEVWPSAKPAEKPKPKVVFLPGIGSDIYTGQPGDSTWQDTQEPMYGTYIKHEDGTWSIQYKNGGGDHLGENSALDNWIGNGLLQPLSHSAKLLAQTAAAPKVEPDEGHDLAKNAEPAVKPLMLHGKSLGNIPADATPYWSTTSKDKLEANAAAYYVKYGDGSWGIFVEGQKGDQGTSEGKQLDELVKVGALVKTGEQAAVTPDKPEEIPAILDNKLLGMVPAGSKFYKGEKPEYGYTPYYVLKPDGTWLESPYGNNLSKSYYGAAKQLEKGSIKEIPGPTAQEIADAKGAQELIAWAKTAAISKADAQKSWKHYFAEKLTGKGGGGYGDHIFQSGGGKWSATGYPPHNANEYWKVDTDSLIVEHHIKPNPQLQEGLSEKVPVSEIIDAVKGMLTPNAVTMDDGKVYKFGYYYSAKGTAYLEIKEAKSYGKYHKNKYGKAGVSAAFVWHDTKGQLVLKTPNWATSQLEKNTEYHETPKEFAPKATFANKYATTSEPGSYMLWSDDKGAHSSSFINIQSDGSASWQDKVSGEHGTLYGSFSSLEGGAVLDQYGTSVVEPGVIPTQYHLFGSPGKTYMELEALRNQLQTNTYGWVKELWNGIGGQTEFSKSKVMSFVQDKGAGVGGEEQKHAIIGLINELLNIPQQQAGSKAVAPAEVKYLKGLPPGIYGPTDVFKFVKQGYATKFAGSLDNNKLVLMGSPDLADTIKAISAEFGGGKIVGTHPAGLTKGERLAWIAAWKKGDMQAVFNLDAKGGKVSPAHPGAPDNTVTHHITWAPWDTGQIAASKDIEGTWSDLSITPLKDEVDNYLIKVNVAHAAFLSDKERRALVKAHRNHDQEAVDELSRTASERAKDGTSKPLTAPPVWHDTLQPAKSYSVFLEDAKPAASWSVQAKNDFVEHYHDALLPFAQQQVEQYGYSSAENVLAGSSSKTNTIQSWLDAELQKAKDEEMRPKWALVEGKPGYVVNQFGKEKLWFTGSKAELGKRVAVNTLARAFGFKTPKAEYAKLEDSGKPGIITDEVKPTGSLDALPGGLTSLENRQLADIAREHVLDYLLANPSSSAASMLILGGEHGGIVSAGKPGAFSDLAWKGTDLAHLDDQFKQPVSLLFDSMKNGGIGQASADEAYVAAMRTAQRMSKLSDKRLAQALEGTGLDQAGVAALTARKNALADDIKSMWDQVYSALGWTPPEVPEAAISHGIHSGFQEVDSMEHLDAAKNAGVGFFFNEPGLANGVIHSWQEYNPAGHLDIRGEAVMRGKSLKNLIAWVKQHSGDSSKLAPKDEASLHIAILKAAQTVEWHWGPDAGSQYGYFGGPETSKIFEELEATRLDLQQRLQLAEQVLEEGAASKAYQEFIDKYGDPHAVVSMAKMYLDQISTVNQTKVSGAALGFNDYPQWELKGQVFEAAGGIKVEYKQVKRYLGLDSNTVNENSWPLDPKTGHLHLKKDLSVTEEGNVWQVTLPTGEVVDISDEEESNTPKAQHGRVRFTAVAENGSSSLENIRSFFQEAGLPMQEATQASMENLYWRLVATDMADRADRKSHGAMWKVLANAVYGTGPGALAKMKGKHLGSLVDDLGAMDLPAEEENLIWREAMGTELGADKVEQWVENKSYLPHFNHYSLHSQNVPGGKPIWYRPDVTPEQVAKKNFLVNHLYSPNTDAVLVARAGGLFSSEGRIRALGTHKTGMSWGSDKIKGSSGFVFLRQNLGKGGSGDYQVWISPRVAAQLQSYSFNQDHYGNVALRHDESYWNFDKHTQHTGGSNEMMIPDAVTLLDDIEVLQAASETQRAKIIKDLKSFGITTIRGLPVEDRIVTNYGVADALAKAKAELAKQAKDWFVPSTVEWSTEPLPADATPAEKAAHAQQAAMDLESQASQIASEAGGAPFTATKNTDAFGNEYVTLNVPVVSTSTSTVGSTYNMAANSITADHLATGPVVQWQPSKWTISDGEGYTTGGTHTYHYPPKFQKLYKNVEDYPAPVWKSTYEHTEHDKSSCPFCQAYEGKDMSLAVKSMTAKQIFKKQQLHKLDQAISATDKMSEAAQAAKDAINKLADKQFDELYEETATSTLAPVFPSTTVTKSAVPPSEPKQGDLWVAGTQVSQWTGSAWNPVTLSVHSDGDGDGFDMPEEKP